MCEHDTREQLEADVHSAILQWGWDSEWSRNEQRSNERVAMLWLDRQEAITRRECVEKRDGQNEHETVRQDELSDTREQLEAEVMVTVGNLVQYCDAHPVLFEKAKSWLDRQAAITTKAMQDYVNRKLSIRGWKAQMDKLKAERDELQAAIDAMGNGQFYAMYRKACEERDHFKDLVRKQSESNH